MFGMIYTKISYRREKNLNVTLSNPFRTRAIASAEIKRQTNLIQ